MSSFRPKRWSGGKNAVRSFAAQAEAPATADVDATDAAKAFAAQHGIDLSTVTGTGDYDRITKNDVVAALEQSTTEPDNTKVEAEPADEPSSVALS